MKGWITHIVVPVDGSEHARHAAAFGAELARAFDATLSLLHVVHLSPAEALGARYHDRSEVMAMLMDRAGAIFHNARHTFADLKGAYEVREITEIGDPVTEILSFAKRNEVDLIVIGSRGLTPVAGLLLGSVSEQVTRRAHCPVTVVR